MSHISHLARGHTAGWGSAGFPTITIKSMSRVGTTSRLFASWVVTLIPTSRNTSTALGSTLPPFRAALKTCVLGGRSFFAIASAMKLRQSLLRDKNSIFLSRILERIKSDLPSVNLSTCKIKSTGSLFVYHRSSRSGRREKAKPKLTYAKLEWQTALLPTSTWFHLVDK